MHDWHLSTGEAKAKVRGLGKTQNASTFVLKTEIRMGRLAHCCA